MQGVPHTPDAGGGKLPYLPGLDGLRALAVIAVLLYHAELSWMPGGFLGVEVFFVISGYLITSLLLAEWRTRGRIDLKAFWLRRARRLLPALYLVLIATLGFSVVFLPEEVAGLREDALAAFGYVTNWYLIIGQESYFEAVGRPSLLKHLWSLAVEEQFYLLWPPVLTLGLSLGARYWRLRRMMHLALAGAAASALLMAVLYDPNTDPSRVYYGTDTRATGLLLGAALAFVWAPGRGPVSGGADLSATVQRLLSRQTRWTGRLRRRWGWISPVFLDLAGLAALGGLVLACLKIGEFDPLLYRGGLALVGLATAGAIAVVVHPRASLNTRLLGCWPLRWIGLRSYGIYLWHWPVFMVTRPDLDVPVSGLPLLSLRLAATVLLAELSYRYVEMPIRSGALGRAWKRLQEARGARRWELGLRWAGVTGMGAVFCLTLGIAVAQARQPEPPAYLSMKGVHTETTQSAPQTTIEEKATEKAGSPSSTQARLTGPAGKAGEPAVRVTAIGDSVMLGASKQLRRDIPNLGIDAETGLQASDAISLLQAKRDAGELGDVVVLHIGNNGPITPEQMDEIMDLLKGVPRVVLVDVKVPRPWEQPNNKILAEAAQESPNAVLVDWYAASANWPELFWDDGIHLRPEGWRVYADLITKWSAPQTPDHR